MSRTATTVSAAPVVTLQAPAAFALPNDQESRQRGSLGTNDGAIVGLGTLAWTTGFRLAFCFGVRLAAGFAFARCAFAGLTLARLAFPAGPFAFAFAGARSSSTHSAVPARSGSRACDEENDEGRGKEGEKRRGDRTDGAHRSAIGTPEDSFSRAERRRRSDDLVLFQH